MISNAEFRDAVLHGGDVFRSQILWQIEQARNDEEESRRREWSALALEFFKDVWPRQRTVKNPVMSTRLCELLLSSSEGFPELVDIVLPLLTKLTAGMGSNLHLPDETSKIVSKHPKHVLALLDAVLPDEVSDWPYGIEEVLERLSEAGSDVFSDRRLQRLKRMWTAR